MRFCQEHWDILKAAIDKRNLSSLIAPNAKTAVAQLADHIDREEITVANFDPLMNAHWAIAANVMDVVVKAGGNPLYLMAGDSIPEDPVEIPGYEGRVWPRCPLCYLNLAHEVSCTDPKCILDKKRGYDYFIERAADDQVEKWKELQKDIVS